MYFHLETGPKPSPTQTKTPMTSGPLVSVCIPTYRGAAFIRATIDSVLQQSYANLEVWVVDDKSPDDTEAIVRDIHDDRVRYVRNEANLGPNGNWNRCLELASGTYYKLLPHDDLLAPGSIAEHVAILEADAEEEVALVFGSRLVIDHKDRPIFRRGLSGRPSGRILSALLVRRCVRAGTNLIGEPGNGLIRRSVAERVGHYDAQHPYLVDCDYWFRVLKHGDGFYTAKQSSCFRISQGSWSVALGMQQLQDFKGLVERFATDSAFEISSLDKKIGYARAWANTVARAAIYRVLFRSAT